MNDERKQGPAGAQGATKSQGLEDAGPANNCNKQLQARGIREKRAKKYNQEHAREAAEFQKLTGVDPMNIAAVKNWQAVHNVTMDGKVGPKTLQAAKPQAAGPEAEASESRDVNFSDEEAGTVETASEDEAKEESGDAASVVAGADTSHNRKDEEKEEGHEEANEVADFVLETLDSMGIKKAGKAGLVLKLSRVRSARDLYEVLKDEVSPELLVELVGKAAKRFAWEKTAEIAEGAAPAVAGASVGLEFAELSMKYIIGPANEEGRQRGQLNRYASAWAFRLLDDGYAPDMLAEIDEQTTLMNTCSRLGVEDAVKTISKLGDGVVMLRRNLIAHYGGVGVARENLVIELLKQAHAL